MIKEIEAKSILNRNQHPSSWFGVNYNMNIYRGCSHGCIYCDTKMPSYEKKKSPIQLGLFDD